MAHQLSGSAGTSVPATSHPPDQRRTMPPGMRPRRPTRKPRYSETGYCADSEKTTDEDGDVEDEMEVDSTSVGAHATAVQSADLSPEAIQLRSRIELIQTIPDDHDDLASTLLDIIAYFRSIAAEQLRPIHQVSVAIRDSEVDLNLYEVLQLFQGREATDDHESIFSDNLVSTLLANEKPEQVGYSVAPVYSTANWLDKKNQDLEGRCHYMSADILKVLNGQATTTRRFPFEGIGTENMTRHMLFLYKPLGWYWIAADAHYRSLNINGVRTKTGFVSLYNPVPARNIDSVNAALQPAKWEMVPLLTLARLQPSSPFSDVRWTEDNIDFADCPRSTSRVDSGPLSVFTAIFVANKEPLPADCGSGDERKAFVWRIRLACARRILNLLTQQSDTDSRHTLFSLLKTHVRFVGSSRPRLSKQSIPGVSQSFWTHSRPANEQPEVDTGKGEPGYEAFRDRKVYKCPFENGFNDVPPCDKSFPRAHGRTTHVRLVHGDDGIPFPDDSSEDGTEKVACQYECGEMFYSYKQAKEHASRRECSAAPKGKVICTWNKVTGCTKDFSANHIRTHYPDERGPYRCHRCGQSYAERYTLGLHVDKCKGKGAKPRPKQMLRLALSKDNSSTPGVFIIVRSSSKAPDTWYDASGSLEGGLYAIGRALLQEVRRTFDVRAPAVIHAGWNMKTRELPASDEYEDRFDDDDHHRVQKNNAFKWTKAINEDLRRAVNPIIVTAGWDGWTSNTSRLADWLGTVPDFRWILRIPNLKYDADESLLTKAEDVWWANLKSTDILHALNTSTTPDAFIGQCIRIMRRIQTGKNARAEEHALFNGRNLIKKSNEHSDIETDCGSEMNEDE